MCGQFFGFKNFNYKNFKIKKFSPENLNYN